MIDKVSRRSKGVAYVEFVDEDGASKAISMSGYKLLGIPIIIQASESEKNGPIEELPPGAPHIVLNPRPARSPPPIESNRLFVGNLNLSVTEDDLRRYFDIFGPMDYINLHFDSATGRSKGFAFIQYALFLTIRYRHLSDARQAVRKMNGYEVQGRPVCHLSAHACRSKSAHCLTSKPLAN